MYSLGYLPDEEWINQFIGFEDALNTDIQVFTTDTELAGKAMNYFSRVYLANIRLFNLLGIREALKKIVEKYKPDMFIAPCTNKGRAVAGTLIGLLKCVGISDVINVGINNNILEIERLVYGGTAKAILKASPPIALCIAPGYYKGVPKEMRGELIDLGKIEGEIEGEFKAKEVSGNDPAKADTVIVAGRGVKEKRDLELIRNLADKLRGAWSVTRPLAADYGWTETWIGISGLVITPKIYFGVGVSGQPHHMMGARNSKIIIAINKDPDAPIFEEADYGFIGDLYKILPALLKKLE